MTRPSLLALTCMVALPVLALSIVSPEAQAYLLPHGEWQVDGTAGDGQVYSGTLEVEAKRKYWDVRWRTPAAPRDGIGFYEKTKSGKRLYVGWGGSTDGVMHYEIKSNGDLDGKWSALGRSGSRRKFGEETLIGPGDGVAAGVYVASGKSPTGQAYTGLVTVLVSGPLYRLTWVVNGSVTTGVGLREGSHLTVSYGSGRHGVMVYTFHDHVEETAEGRWTVAGADQVASERLSRAPKRRVTNLRGVILDGRHELRPGMDLKKVLKMLGDPKRRTATEPPDRHQCHRSVWRWKNFQAEVCVGSHVRTVQCWERCRAWLRPMDIRVGTLERYVQQAFRSKTFADTGSDTRVVFDIDRGRVTSMWLGPIEEYKPALAPGRPGLRDGGRRPGLRPGSRPGTPGRRPGLR